MVTFAGAGIAWASHDHVLADVLLVLGSMVVLAAVIRDQAIGRARRKSAARVDR